MPPDADLQKADLIKKAIAEIRNRLGKKVKKQFAGFLTAYFPQARTRRTMMDGGKK